MTPHLSALLAAFDSLGVESVSVRVWPHGAKPEHIVTIDAGDRVAEVAAKFGAPPPTDKLDGTKTWLSSRLERDGLVITIIGAWRELRAA